MRISTIGLLGFMLFLVVYTYVKYAAAAPPQFVADYAKSVAILVALTGIGPLIVSFLAARLAPFGLALRLVVSAIVGIVACVGAYALYFKLFIAGAAPGVEVFDVAKRGVGWGALIGAIAALAATNNWRGTSGH